MSFYERMRALVWSMCTYMHIHATCLCVAASVSSLCPSERLDQCVSFTDLSSEESTEARLLRNAWPLSGLFILLAYLATCPI